MLENKKESGAIVRPILALDVAIDFALAQFTSTLDGKSDTGGLHKVSLDFSRSDAEHIESAQQRSSGPLMISSRYVGQEYLRHGIAKLRDRNIDADRRDGAECSLRSVS